MNDPVIALCNVARFALNHAAVQCPEGEAKDRLHVALAATNDAIDERTGNVKAAATLRHLEVIADALAAPGTSQDEA